ncbi:MAG: Nif3-like dinuclear metal center hexameric protein [Clostridia bacterium]|nr:Nif3-like dinuclear metal center hexameric protein [Clostridia bacterium]
MTVKDVYDLIDAFAPFDSQADFDHSGLQAGDFDAPVTGVVVAVDLTPAVIAECKALGANLIVTHHPAIWSPLAAVVQSDYTGRLIASLIRDDLNYIAAHTNVDKCAGGNSERLVQSLGGEVTGRLDEDEYAVTFRMPPIRLSALRSLVRERLDDVTAYAVGRDDLTTEGALCTGAGASDETVASCVQRGLVYLTGECKHHQLRYAEQNNGHLICFGHFTSEQIFVTIIIEILQKAGVNAYASCQKNPCVIG